MLRKANGFQEETNQGCLTCSTRKNWKNDAKSI